MKSFVSYLFVFGFFICVSCKKEEVAAPQKSIVPDLITDFSNKVAHASYIQISHSADDLYLHAEKFVSTPTNENLHVLKDSWRELRKEWELSEAFLFGPVATDGLDPQIDTWPINRQDLDSLLLANNNLDEAYMLRLQESLKGFHPLEYLIFGESGTKHAAEFTSPEFRYLLALAKDIKRVCNYMPTTWEATQGNYITELTNAGKSSSVYATKREVLLEITHSMAGICDEVANGKIEEPFSVLDPSLEESPFSKNSFADFKNNITGVLNVYTCSYKEKGVSMSDFVKQYNSSLDNKIKSAIYLAISSFDAFKEPFGTAIMNEQTQLKNTQESIIEVQRLLEEELVKLINERLKE